jgi:uncharacterized protein with gpF-like domain
MAIIRKKPATLPVIWPNVGISNRYKKAILKLLSKISTDINQTLVKEFRKQAEREKANMAMDGISDWVAHVVDYLSSKWLDKLDKLAPEIAASFINKTITNYESQLKAHMRKAGFTVRFQITPYQRDTLQAELQENIRLIKSIGSQYLDRVQGQVWQCVTNGYDLSTLAKDLKKSYGISSRRAEFIARNQGSRAHAVIEEAKRRELGITKAIWMHSHRSKVPRPSHLEADGKVFDVSKGMYLDGKWVQPGKEIGCNCCSKSIIEGIDT